jgi:hypothetical protein
MKRTVRSAFASAAAFIIAALAIAACGELTGPESPSTPTNVVATLASATSVTVTWTPSPLNDGVISYSIYRNGQKVGESPTTSFTDTGLAQQTTYVYSVAANCKGGVVSDRSAETAQSTVTTVDITPPTVADHQPPTNFNGVSSEATVTATFSEPMTPSTINATTFTVRVTSSGAAVPGTVTYNTTTRIAEFKSTGALPNPANLTATITTGVKDLAGNSLAAPFSWAFTTRDDTPPTVSATTPQTGATGVSPSAPITVTFSENMDASTITASNITVRTTVGGTAVAGAVAYNTTTRVATFTPSAPLAQSTGYTVTVASAVKDVAGNLMGTNYVFSFTTGDTTAPTVLQVIPKADSVNVPTNSTIQVFFSEAMDQATITATTVTLRTTVSDVLVTTSLSYNASTNVLTITPAGGLAPSTGYTVTIVGGAAGVKDISGNPLAATVTSRFTTAALPDVTPPKVVSITPVNGATGIAVDTVVRVRFTEAMLASSINASSITLRLTSGSAANVAATVTCTATPCVEAVLDPTANLLNDTSYTVTVTTNVKDLAGHPMALDSVSIFRTKADADRPFVVNTSPGDNTLGNSRTAAITVTFNEPLKATTVTASTVFVTPTAGGSNAAGTVSYNASLMQAIFTPQAGTPLLANTQYTVTVTSGVQDLAGNGLLGTFQFRFTTGP